ncbi:MAG TPA: tetratricopeptide repeat protein [Bryobacteraceae bacterium]
MTGAALLFAISLASDPASAADPRALDAALLKLAAYLEDHGRYREAEPLYLRSRAINETLYGPSSIEAARSLLRLGAIYHAEFQNEAAEAAARHALELFQTLTGPSSEEVACASANLAVILADEGQPARAEPTLRRALFLLRQHSSDRGYVAIVEENLAMVYLRQGELIQARPLLEDVLRRDPSHATAWAALAELSIAERHWPEAAEYIEKAYRLVEERFGKDHPWMIGILHLRSAIEAHSDDWRQAALDMKNSIELLESTGGPNSTRLAIFLDDEALILRHLGRHAGAKAARKRAREIRSSTVTR